MAQPGTIFITGASSGLGKALALAYAGAGVALLLTGRNAERLEETASLCRAKGAAVETACIGVQDPAFGAQVEAWNAAHTIDLVIANAGVSSETSGAAEDAFKAVLDINLMGVVNTVNPLLATMQERKRGHIVLVSSMAGLRGLPNAVAYSVSKVAVTAYGDALRPLLKEYGITVTTVFPGFIRTRITDLNRFAMPLLMDADCAAKKIQTAIAKKKARYGFPWPMYALSAAMALLPRAASDWILMTCVPRKR